ncbi:GTP-binding protein [Verrucomicrobiales bacterium]|jgi:G3E family GTPase|nr:GTP-binding protein [Verrucomicrobiales bacterium]
MSKPLLFITGFLGAGKTTLLRALLNEFNRRGKTADVILNDYENADIDASTLPESSASIFPLAASCACCDSLDDLVKLCLAAQKSEGDALIIELNGTADPLPLLETFTLLEEKMPFSPRWQVGIVDARYWEKREAFGALQVRQVETATHWMLTHAEGLTTDETEKITESVEVTNPYAVRVDAARLADELAAAEDVNTKRVHGSQSHEHGSNSIHDHEHALSHRFTGCQIPLPGRYRVEQMIRFMESLPDEVVRAKALVKLSEEPGPRWLFERTGRHPVEQPVKVDSLRKVSASLVCIGPGLNPSALREMVMNSFGV